MRADPSTGPVGACRVPRQIVDGGRFTPRRSICDASPPMDFSMRGRIVKVAVALCGLAGAVYAADEVTAPPQPDLNRALATQLVNEGRLANALPNAPADTKYTSEQMMILAPKYAADMEGSIEHAQDVRIAAYRSHDIIRMTCIDDKIDADEDAREPGFPRMLMMRTFKAEPIVMRVEFDVISQVHDRVTALGCRGRRLHGRQPRLRFGRPHPRREPVHNRHQRPVPSGPRRSRPSTAPPRRALTTERAGRVNLPAVYAPLSRFLLRAPLLPTASLARAARALTAHPLGAAAIAVASPTLAGAAAGPARERSITRYARRAAFRATPSGLLAGVCVGELGPRTDVATGKRRAAPGAELGPRRRPAPARCSTIRRSRWGPAARGAVGVDRRGGGPLDRSRRSRSTSPASPTSTTPRWRSSPRRPTGSLAGGPGRAATAQRARCRGRRSSRRAAARARSTTVSCRPICRRRSSDQRRPAICATGWRRSAATPTRA